MLILASCKDKVICPAFQSTYILDDSVRNTYFSYAWYLNEDERKSIRTSQPKVLPPDSLGEMVASANLESGVDYFAYTADYKVLPRVPKRTKYGIVKRTPIIPNLVRNFQLKSSPMQNVLTPPEVTEEEEVTPNPIPTDSSALAPLDSTATIAAGDSLNVSQPADSTAVANAPTDEDKKKAWVQFKYGFNPMEPMQPDQEYYFQKYGWLLQNAAPKNEPVDNSQLETNGEDTVSSDSTTQRKGLKGLFKKKDKPKKEKNKNKESTESEAPSEAPFGDNEEATKPEEGGGDGSND